MPYRPGRRVKARLIASLAARQEPMTTMITRHRYGRTLGTVVLGVGLALMTSPLAMAASGGAGCATSAQKTDQEQLGQNIGQAQKTDQEQFGQNTGRAQKTDQEQLGQYTGRAQHADQEQLGQNTGHAQKTGEQQLAMNNPGKC
jgi:hypothetical protein